MITTTSFSADTESLINLLDPKILMMYRSNLSEHFFDQVDYYSSEYSNFYLIPIILEPYHIEIISKSECRISTINWIEIFPFLLKIEGYYPIIGWYYQTFNLSRRVYFPLVLENNLVDINNNYATLIKIKEDDGRLYFPTTWSIIINCLKRNFKPTKTIKCSNNYKRKLIQNHSYCPFEKCIDYRISCTECKQNNIRWEII